ncbi:restriction endonuclease subunit S, partial [uncultured Duncaniella sp.]|uniref:restriction endonuclease subunit S n=1 Tax=uncultured Duncaniella sp. TaxID=2768039 RepID=UPI002617A577
KYYEQIGKEKTEVEPIFKIPESWAWVKLPYIGNSILGKTLDKGKDGGIETPYLCSINVYWCGISTTTVKRALFSESEREKYRLNKGDLLICEGGDVGRCSIWDSEMPMWYQNALHRVRLNRNISPEFIKMVIEFYKHTGIIDRMCKGVTIKHFTQNLLYSILLPLPPKQEQERIVIEYKRLLQKL